ncbi:hypothetical protein HPP92_006886 [Vanilla planifolia]|uniref:F-box domain-containing protein n=1 Tax=Vanilla planifolia TaxID=51239 RepID=A0A835R9G2_VANPL|nr:hypothetical protein HPP92_006886 [Vanilla planifolia]
MPSSYSSSPFYKSHHTSACSGGEYDVNPCGSVLFLSLPEDVLAQISSHLLPRDLCSLSISCRSLRFAVSSSEKSWLVQCLRAGLSARLLPRWRAAVISYRALCRFITVVSPLLGLWVHQYPELGNVVFVLWGFLSVIGCRVIPQEFGPLGLAAGPILWAPVFEILANSDGFPEFFFLHGREVDDSLYPGIVRSIHRDCNVLLLEVDTCCFLPRSFAASHNNQSKRCLHRSDTTVSTSLPPPKFSKLAFGDRRRLLDLVAGRVRLKVPRDLLTAPLFPPSPSSPSFDGHQTLMEKRRLNLIRMHKLSSGRVDCRRAELHLESSDSHHKSSIADEISPALPTENSNGKVKNLLSVAGHLRDGIRHFIGKSRVPSLASSNCKSVSSTTFKESKHAQLHEFLRTGDTIELSLCASKMKLTAYRAWPNMQDNRFALYKLPLHPPADEQEYSGLWGGTFGWPPGRSSEDKPSKALFLLLISYEEIDGHPSLIATKILEGTHNVLHPNGSSMFVVRLDEPSSDPFPWESYGNSSPVEVRRSYMGEGIANGYGFRYPGSKPGSLFEIQNGNLAFVWKEPMSVLTLQRLDLEDLLKKGKECRPC